MTMNETATSRNAPCPCGSGKKYKSCCYEKDAKPAGGLKGKQNLVIAAGVALIVVLIFGGMAVYSGTRPGPYDDFAKCLTRKGFKMYGASWCSYCTEQKTLFSSSFKHVDYVECADPAGGGVLQMCKDRGVEKLPTWFVSGGQKVTGVLSLADLSQRSGCELPETAQ
jgi:hypothetical protein